MNGDNVASGSRQGIDADRHQFMLMEMKRGLTCVQAAATAQDRESAARYLYNALLVHDAAIEFVINDSEMTGAQRSGLETALTDLNRQIARVMQLMFGEGGMIG